MRRLEITSIKIKYGEANIDGTAGEFQNKIRPMTYRQRKRN